MLTEAAKVLSISNDAVLLETQKPEHCSGCSASSACGHRLMSKLQPHRSRQLSIPERDFKGKPGDYVTIAIDEKAILHLSLLYYLLPLVSMILPVLITELLNFNDLGIIFSALFGLILGFLGLAFIARRNKAKPKYQATLCYPLSHHPITAEWNVKNVQI